MPVQQRTLGWRPDVVVRLLVVSGMVALGAIPAAAQGTPTGGRATDAEPRRFDSRVVCSRAGLSDPAIKALRYREFASVISPQLANTVGSFAAVNLKDAEASLGVAKRLAQSGVVGAKVSGAAAEGLLSVLSGDRFSPTVTVDVQYHRLLLKERDPIVFRSGACIAYQEAMEEISTNTALRHRQWDITHAPAARRQELARLDTLLLVTAAAIGRVTLAGDSLRTTLTSDSLAKLWAIRKQAYASRAQLQMLRTDLQQANRDQAEKDRAAAVASVPLERFTIGWFSVGLTAATSSFRLIDPAAAPAEQVAKRSYTAPGARLQYSRFRYVSYDESSYFASLSLAGSSDHTLSELKKHEVVEETALTPTPGERVTRRAFTAHEGPYAAHLKTSRLKLDYLNFISNGTRTAVHLAPSVTVREKRKPTTDFDVGMLLALPKGAAVPGRLNIELLVRFPDLFDVAGSNKEALKRAVAGLQLTFPFNFNAGTSP
jgi:hypothetical protein